MRDEMKNITLWHFCLPPKSSAPAEFTLLINDTKQGCTHIYRLEARKHSSKAQSRAQAIHFLESLTCLCFGGAHLRQTESTVGEKRHEK